MARRIHLVLRSYGGENTKGRPAYYSKLLCLLSFIRAACEVPEADVIFLNDGPVPAVHLALMERYGTVVQIPDGPIGMRGSFWPAITLPQQHPEWPDSDIVSLNEDDYLYRPDAFSVLAEAAAQISEAGYFSTYGARPDYDSPTARAQFGLPRGWKPAPDRVVEGRTWFNQPGITSTITARAGALRSDELVFRQCMFPFRNRFLDHESCLINQGVVPYRGLDTVLGLPGDLVLGLRGIVRTIALIPIRLALNLHAVARPRRHLLYCLTPNASTHLDLPVVSPDQDWLVEAHTVHQWATKQGLTEAADSIAKTLDREDRAA